MGGQNDKVHLKNIKLFRIIPKKKIFNFFQKGGPKALLVLLIIRHCSHFTSHQYCYMVDFN